MLELTYTSHAMKPWAEDLGYSGQPFAWNEDRRAQLRAELDAFFAKKYGLSEEELRYVLDPAKAKGAIYPSETFRVLKEREIRQYGEYRTESLVLEARRRMEELDQKCRPLPVSIELRRRFSKDPCQTEHGRGRQVFKLETASAMRPSSRFG